MRFGNLVRGKRLELRMSLRTFCHTYKHDPSNWSKMERGIISPPQGDDKLRKIADQLTIEYGSDDWHTFADAAAVARGIVPKDIMSDEELVNSLPLFFRAVRKGKKGKEQLLELAEHIRNNP